MTIDLATVVEYESQRVRITDRQARSLAEAASGALTVATDPEPGWWRITAQHYVGSLEVDGLRLLIRPKIRPENLFLLLEVGLQAKDWRQEAYDYASTHDLLPSVIAFFTRTVETTLARGLLRSYREVREPLVALRGRLDLAAQFTRSGIASPVACRYDDFTADIAENRYLRTALRRALQVPRVAPADRRRLMQQLVALEDVADVGSQPEDIDHINFTRLNSHYEPALRLARLILANLTLVDQRGSTTASSFLLDMNRLFERFVTERLRRALQGRLDVRAEPPVFLGEQRQVFMKPDLTFVCRTATVYVGDIKYKITHDAGAKNGDYYQLLAYTTALDLPEGVLIYCMAEGGAPERAVTVRHAGKLLHTRAIDLSGPPARVGVAMAELAEWIVERATLAMPRWL